MENKTTTVEVSETELKILYLMRTFLPDKQWGHVIIDFEKGEVVYYKKIEGYKTGRVDNSLASGLKG